MSSKMSAKELVKTLNALFANFDKLAEVRVLWQSGMRKSAGPSLVANKAKRSARSYC